MKAGTQTIKQRPQAKMAAGTSSLFFLCESKRHMVEGRVREINKATCKKSMGKMEEDKQRKG